MEKWYEWIEDTTEINREPKIRKEGKRKVITEKEHPEIADMFPKFDREKGNPLTIIPSSGGRLLEPYEKIMKVVIKILGKHNIPMIVNASAKEGINSFGYLIMEMLSHILEHLMNLKLLNPIWNVLH